MKSNLKKNFIYQMFYEVLVLILPLVSSPYVSRVFGDTKIGVFSFTYAIATYFGMFAMMGVKNHGNREIAKIRDNNEKVNLKFWNIFAVQMFFSIVSIICYLAYIFIFVENNRELLLINLLYVLSCMIDIDWFFCGLEKFKITVFRSSLIKIVSFVSIFVFVKSDADLWKYCLIMSGSCFVSQAILWLNLSKYVSKPKLRINEFKNNIKPMLFLFIPVVAVSLYNIMDKIMLGYFCEKKYLGYYENSEKIIFCSRTVIISVGTVMLPRMSKLVADKNVQIIRNYLSKSIEFVMFMAFALAFGISSVSYLFSLYFWGDKFLACSNVLKLLCIAVPFTAFANVIRTQYLIPNNHDKQYITSVCCGALINVVLNLLLIKKFNVVGACIGTIAAEVVVCAIQCYYVRKELDIKLFILKSLPYLFFGLTMFAVVFCVESLMSQSIITLFIQIFVGMIIYGILTFIWGYKNKKSVFYEYVTKVFKMLKWGDIIEIKK